MSTIAPAAAAVHEALARGATVLLDGATGTELERRGASMHEDTWCAMATRTHPDILRQVHEDYIRAGARVITANTFASTRAMLGPAGLGEHVEAMTREAVAIALEARDRVAARDEVAVAGSMSHMLPVAPGTAVRDGKRTPSLDELRESFRETAGLLADAGAELLLMEMMYDPHIAPLALAAARETGLPLWVGYACKDGGGLGPVSYSYPDVPLAQVLAAVPPDGATVAGIMHTAADITGVALDTLRDHTDAVLMAYPDSGHFEMPHWKFEKVMTPAQFVEWCRRWRDDGVRVLGGCCGLGLAHIEALAAHLANHG